MSNLLDGQEMNNWAGLLHKIDKDGDGRVNYEEFCTAAYDRSKLLNNKNLEQAFTMLDTDRNGRIDRTELSRCLA